MNKPPADTTESISQTKRCCCGRSRGYLSAIFSILGILATLWVGYQAMQIQLSISEESRQSSAANWTLQLYTIFINGKLGKDISEFSSDFLIDFWTIKNRPNVEMNKAVDIAFRGAAEKYGKNQLRQMGMEILRVSETLYTCGGYETLHDNPLSEQDQEVENNLCEQNSIDAIFLPRLAYFYFYMRPLFYCDKFFQENFSHASVGKSSIEKLELLMVEYLERDFKGEVKVFQNVDEVNQAKKNDLLSDEENWVVVKRADCTQPAFDD